MSRALWTFQVWTLLGGEREGEGRREGRGGEGREGEGKERGGEGKEETHMCKTFHNSTVTSHTSNHL